jgi:hypothetical protein
MTGSQSVQSLPALELPCDKCQGRGWYSHGGGEREACPLCDGSGFVPTIYGEMVLALVRHNLKPMLQNTLR